MKDHEARTRVEHYIPGGTRYPNRMHSVCGVKVAEGKGKNKMWLYNHTEYIHNVTCKYCKYTQKFKDDMIQQEKDDKHFENHESNKTLNELMKLRSTKKWKTGCSYKVATNGAFFPVFYVEKEDKWYGYYSWHGANNSSNDIVTRKGTKRGWYISWPNKSMLPKGHPIIKEMKALRELHNN